jgi:hypothetical protein
MFRSGISFFRCAEAEQTKFKQAKVKLASPYQVSTLEVEVIAVLDISL